jgi:hypothetical protein
MIPFLRPLLASLALCSVLPAHAELDVARLKTAIEASVETTIQSSTRSTRTFTPILKLPFRR